MLFFFYYYYHYCFFTVCNRACKSHQRTPLHFFNYMTSCQKRCTSSNRLFYKLELCLFGCRSTPHSKQHSYDLGPKTKRRLYCSISKPTLIVLSVCIGLLIAAAIIIPLVIILRPTGTPAHLFSVALVFMALHLYYI